MAAPLVLTATVTGGGLPLPRKAPRKPAFGPGDAPAPANQPEIVLSVPKGQRDTVPMARRKGCASAGSCSATGP